MTEATGDIEKNSNETVEMEEQNASAAEAEALKEDIEEIKDNVQDIKDEVEAKAQESEDYKAKYFYLAAEMENARKRFERDKDSLLKFGNEKILTGLVDVVDNLDRSIDAISTDEDEKIKNIFIGIEMVRNQFLEVLKTNGLERFDSLGETFDPNFHEAMAQQPAEGKQEDEIIQEFQKGYKLNGRLLRAAKVIITKND